VTEAEFQELYRALGPAVRARCRAVCGNHADADEALQETFLRAWRSRARFDGRHPLAWLMTIARNTSLDVLRRRRPWRDDPAVWLQIPAPERTSAGAALDVRRMLEGLPAEEAAMLRLRHAEGWRIHEIAEHFDTSQRSVRRCLARAEALARGTLQTGGAA
jgi:RNA polymerase sigma-70 factor, ECF subfamily